MTPQEIKDAIDAAVAKELNKSEARIKEQADKIAKLLELQEAQDAKIKKLEREQLQLPVKGQLKYEGKLSNEHIAKAFGTIALALRGGENSSHFKTLENEYGIVRGATENNEGNAGVLVMNDMRRDLIRLVNEYGVVASEFKNVPLNSGGLTSWPRRTGGVTVYNPAEAGTITASSMSFGQVNMTPRKWAAMTVFSSEIEEDAIMSIGELFATEVAYAMAQKMDECGFKGDGSATYFNVNGLLPACGSAGVKALTGNAFSEMTSDDLTDAIGMLQDWAEPNAKWYLHRRAYFNGMVNLALSKGGVTAEEVRQNAFRGNRTYLGYPVRLVNALPSAAVNSLNIGCIGDLRQSAYLGTRRSLQLERSKEVYFTTDQLAIRATQRQDIVVAEPGTSTVVGGYVVLQLASG
jgi:HK97 family phage major capsid protein